MDPSKSLEDQFLKLHPCLPVDTRIAIIGAGPSGLSAAYGLARLGYTDVTIFEKYHTVSGMCESMEIEGKIYDLGGQVTAANSAPVISHLAKETGAEFEPMDGHKLATLDPHTGEYRDLNVVNDYVSIASLTLKLQEEASKSGRIGVHALSEIAGDPAIGFLEQNGFQSVPKSVAYGYTASGFGYVQDMAYAYIQEFARTSIAGKIRRVKGGYMSMWDSLSKSLPFQVFCNTEVLKIDRTSLCHKVTVRKDNKDVEVVQFDKIIITGSLPFKNGKTYRCPLSPTDKEDVLELNELEKSLFSKVQTIDYYTTALKIKGLDHLPVGFYYFGEFMDDPSHIGKPVAMQKFFSETDIFLFWSYGNLSDITGPAVAQLAIDVMNNIGGEVEKMVLQRRFTYFPHVKSEDIKEGFYEKLELELQGFSNTYYIGGLLAFELTERNSSYALATICKHFASDNATPPYPYIKRLFPLLSNPTANDLEEIGESPGIDIPNLSSLHSYLRHWGSHKVIQNKILYSWINDDGQVVDQRTYKELHYNASYIVNKLFSSNKPSVKHGDRVLLVYLPGLEFVDAFFGCLYAGVLPVPVLPPDPFQRGGQALLKIENISRACNAVAILSTASYHTAVRAGFVKNIMVFSKNKHTMSARWPDLPWLHTDSWVKYTKKIGSHSDFIISQYEPQPNEVCFLQFTSGSTGNPKGVMITHAGLIHNVKLMRKRYKSSSRTILVSWLPQYHDMGLIGGLFTSLVSGGKAILFSPMTFIKNPLLWLETMSKYRATHSAGPNFAFELMIRRLELLKDRSKIYDLSSVAFLMVAAEPVRQKTLKRFLELTFLYGLRQEAIAPGYGLAENCVFVSCAFGEQKPIYVDWQGRVCCGYIECDDSEVIIKIVDPETGKENEHGKEGEIWISSESSGIGYWGNHELTQQTFGNEIQNFPSKNFTRTGDLGRIIDNKLFITGRIKDLIIVAGKNVYATDVEKTVESSSEFLRPGCCAVVGVSKEILETKGVQPSEVSDDVGLVVIAEVREVKHANEEIASQIKSRIIQEHGISVASIELIKPRTISKTTSGKIKRFECSKQFADGTLSLAVGSAKSQKTLHRSFTTGTCTAGRTPRPSGPSLPSSNKTVQDITDFLKKLVSEQTGIPTEKISSSENLVSYGIDSIGVVAAAQKLSDYLGVPVGAVDIFTAKCISDLAFFSENLLLKSCHPSATSLSDSLESRIESSMVIDASREQQIFIGALQLLVLTFSLMLLILPVYFSSLTFLNMLSSDIDLLVTPPFMSYIAALSIAPLAWILCMLMTCTCISVIGCSFLQPNYLLTPNISIWSTTYVKWWALSKIQEIAGKVFAVHLRETVFMNWWYEMLGAKVSPSALIDSVDITDPALVSIGESVRITEGALIQSHEVQNGILKFRPIRIACGSIIGPYTVVQKGCSLEEGSVLKPLQRSMEGKTSSKMDKASEMSKAPIQSITQDSITSCYHLIGIYSVGFLSSLSAAIVYFLYILISRSPPTHQGFAFVCIAGGFHWFPAVLVAYTVIIGSVPLNLALFASSVAIGYLAHGIILCVLTGIFTRFLMKKSEYTEDHFKTWLRNRLSVSCHLKFAKLLSGTETFCWYLRFLGAKVGSHCSIRSINPVTDPQFLSVSDGVHLGDFSRIITGNYYSQESSQRKINIQKNSVIGSQSVIMPGSTIQEDVILGALSVAPAGSTLQSGGVYVGSYDPVMIKNIFHSLDERIEEMDQHYKKIIGNLAGNLAVTTLKVKSRYFHRTGVSGTGVLKIYSDLPNFGRHKIFSAGKCYPVVIRHSNSLSVDDDARLDARGAALQIQSDSSDNSPLLDLTLKTGKAFYARTISDFARWLVCGVPAREQFVKKFPHVRDAVWGSLRDTDSYTKLHYYSNLCRLLRFDDGEEMYVKFKLRPSDPLIGENSGEVAPQGILPPDTGFVPRQKNDHRPLLFLADDFRRRVDAPGGVSYVLQLQCHPIPSSESECDIALDSTKPWDEKECPYIDIGEVIIDRNLSPDETEQLEFNPYRRSRGVDVIRATSCNQSASVDHGRSLVYDVSQRLRKGSPLPVSLKNFLEQSSEKVNLSGCPIAGPILDNKMNDRRVILARTWYRTLWLAFPQPLLQTLVPYFILGIVVFAPLKWLLSTKTPKMLPMCFILTLLWIASGVVASFSCVLAKWVLVGRRKDGEHMLIWSWTIFLDTAWQALKTVVGDFFLEMTCGSVFLVGLMKLMGSKVELWEGVYVDSLGALLNPEMIEIRKNGCVGREALLFGHIYEGEDGKVKFGKIKIGEGGCVGSRALVMPGVTVEDGGNLESLSLAMKGEVVRSA